MPHIDLFNKSVEEAKFTASILDGTFRFRSKTYAKYIAKCAAEGLVIVGVAALTTIGAIVVISDALNSTTEETE